MVWVRSPDPNRLALTLVRSALILIVSTVVLAGWPGLGTSSPHSSSAVPPVGASSPRPRESPETTVIPSVRPDATITLTALGVSPGAISLSWTPTTDRFFSNYTVAYSSTSSSGPFVSTGVVTMQGTTESVVGSLSPGASLWWQVTENAARHGGATSNVLEVIQPTLAFVTEPMVTSTSITFNWTNNASYGGLLSFQSYTLYERTDGGAYTLAATITNETTHTSEVTGLTTGTSYSFYLDTTDCIGCGTRSPTSSITTSNTVTAGTLIALSVTVSASRPTTDVDQSDLFACTPAGGQSPFTFAWSVAGSAFIAGSSSFATTFASPPEATITCRVTDHLSSEAESAMTVIINRDPTLRLVVNETGAVIGEPFTFICSASGGTPSISVGWSFGDGNTEETENGGSTTHAYTATGTYVPTCTATDAVGFSVAGSTTVTVSSPSGAGSTAPSSPAAFPFWLLAVIGAVVGAVFALGVWTRRQPSEGTESSEVMSRWVPPVGPKTAMQGTKICHSCGASNAPMRRSCQVCGASLPRQPIL